MTFTRACYSVFALNKAYQDAKAINITVTKKTEHFPKWQEVKAVYTFCEENINRWLFDPDGDLKKYREMAYNHKEYKKTDIDAELRRCVNHLLLELESIIRSVNAGDVDSVA